MLFLLFWHWTYRQIQTWFSRENHGSLPKIVILLQKPWLFSLVVSHSPKTIRRPKDHLPGSSVVLVVLEQRQDVHCAVNLIIRFNNKKETGFHICRLLMRVVCHMQFELIVIGAIKFVVDETCAGNVVAIACFSKV